MAKARKPNEEALRAEAQERIRQLPAETAGGRLEESADMLDEDVNIELGDTGQMRGEMRPPGSMTSQMKDKKGNQPQTKPKR